MYSLSVEKRNETIKAKKLKKSGFIPGVIYGGNIEDTLLIQIPEGEAKKLLKNKLKGGNLILNYDSKNLNVLLKEIDLNPVTNQIDNLSFQKLVENEKVVSAAQIILINQNKLPTMVYQLLQEIPYKAMPADLIEKVEIDLENLQAGTQLKLKDLPIYQNPNIEVLLDADEDVLNVVENSKKSEQSQAEEAV